MAINNTHSLIKFGRKFAYQQIGLSIVIVFICALVSYFFMGLPYTYSVIAGGVIGIIPNSVFAYKAFKYAGAKSSKLVVESFFSGVKLKMGITVVLFSLAFKFLVLYIEIMPLPFFGMFCLIMAVPLLTPFLFKL